MVQLTFITSSIPATLRPAIELDRAELTSGPGHLSLTACPVWRCEVSAGQPGLARLALSLPTGCSMAV